MDKIESIVNNYNHSISLVERKNLIVTGVKKIENFDDEEFLLETAMGHLVIKGSDMELVKLDTIQGNVSIKGTIISFSYIEDYKSKSKENGIISRLFK